MIPEVKKINKITKDFPVFMKGVGQYLTKAMRMSNDLTRMTYVLLVSRQISSYLSPLRVIIGAGSASLRPTVISSVFKIIVTCEIINVTDLTITSSYLLRENV